MMLLLTVLTLGACAPGAPGAAPSRTSPHPAAGTAPANALAPERLLESARAGGTYLARTMQRDGRFTYIMEPEPTPARFAYNLVRHAGTIWAMLDLYEQTRDPSLLAAAEHALAYLAAQAEPLGDGRRGKQMVIAEKDEIVELGGSGLALLAMTSHVRATGSRLYLPLAERLAEWILQTQEPSGRYAIHAMTWPDQRVIESRRSEYYDGEATLALLRLHAVTGEVRYLDAADRAARHIITVRDGGKTPAELPPDHWLLYALNELHAARPDALFTDHARKIVTEMQRTQHGPETPPAWQGGWYDPPRSTPAACRAEGMAASWHMFRRADEHEFAVSIRRTIERSVAFQLRSQVTAAVAEMYPQPALAVGGWQAGPTDPQIRIDFVQHNISALLGLRRIMKQD